MMVSETFGVGIKEPSWDPGGGEDSTCRSSQMRLRRRGRRNLLASRRHRLCSHNCQRLSSREAPVLYVES